MDQKRKLTQVLSLPSSPSPPPFPILGSANACVAVQSRVSASGCNSLPISRLYAAIAIIYIQYADFHVTGLRGPVASRRRKENDMCGRIAPQHRADVMHRVPLSLSSSLPLSLSRALTLREAGSFQVYEALVKLAARKRARQEAKGFSPLVRGEIGRSFRSPGRIRKGISINKGKRAVSAGAL